LNYSIQEGCISGVWRCKRCSI